ncbi:hypothetical protein JCM24511_04248 [Saitozyma sp. JCM 24511]|nr:hypothetical protein JCM24511_04248 [Saitozyma sp. JCM 24511]
MAAYTYLTPQVTVIRPQSMREVTALAAFRRGSYRSSARHFDHAHERFHDSTRAGNVAEHLNVEAEANAMLARGFVRPQGNWRSFKKAVNRANQEVMAKWLSR